MTNTQQARVTITKFGSITCPKGAVPTIGEYLRADAIKQARKVNIRERELRAAARALRTI